MKSKSNLNLVFVASAILAIIVAAWGLISNASLESVATVAMQALKDNFSWFYLFVELGFVLFCIVIAFSRFGNIKLGKDNEKAEYSLASWFAMLFAAGMGIGLVFWGVSEPLSHYVNPMAGIDSMSTESAHFALRSCFMHWGLHPWACYAIVGLGLAFIQFRKGQSAMVSNLFIPLFGEKISKGTFGKIVDIFTTVLTIIGVATSFGMGCLQICSGLEYLFGIPSKVITWVIVIALVCCVYLWSATRGVGRGIRLLSDFNMILFVILMVAAFFIGPTSDILQGWVVGIKDYIVNFFPDSVRMSSNGDSSWIQSWRVYYWAWWLSWAPFVGIFIARISKGRTIREFVLGVMFVPTIVSTIWFGVFGGLTIKVADQFSSSELSDMLANTPTTLFHIFAKYPGGTILSLAAIILLITFFITSADSATFVLAMLTSDGILEPPNSKKYFWGIMLAVLGLVMILSGGISMTQTISIVIAFPYMFLMILMCISMVKLFRHEKAEDSEKKPTDKAEEIPEDIVVE